MAIKKKVNNRKFVESFTLSIRSRGAPRYRQVCYSRFRLSVASELCTKLVIHGHFLSLSVHLIPFLLAKGCIKPNTVFPCYSQFGFRYNWVVLCRK
jgi:hypothetical protein